ncbi:CD151 antigen isoform X2 [Nematostella vectensis]|uniref:CD151 antigen isoform X2 n=1 Tax=Nematostella vectensis TaxID=45351 RepID=UPI00138FDF93|nr:CD151 antigen isoform X2 [Nematostella vectensis]
MMEEKKQGFVNAKCLKVPMMMFNFFFLLSGVAMVVLGTWTLIHRNEFNILLDSSWFVIIVGLMIGIGGVVVLICTCGCYGTVKEHRYLLISFLIMLTLVLIVQISVGVIAFVHRAELTHDMKYTTRRRMSDYGVRQDVTKAIDQMQINFKCCGEDNWSTWNTTAWKQSSNNSVPDSCCKTPSFGCGKRDHPSNIYREGCVIGLTVFFRKHLLVLGSVLLGIALIQLIGLIMTVCLLRFVKDYY